MLTKTQQIDNITIDENNIVHVRTATVIAEDNKELSRAYHRNTLSPGADLSEQDLRVVAIATAAWNFAEIRDIPNVQNDPSNIEWPIEP